MSPYSVTLVSNLYSPDELGGAALYTDMMGYFKENGYKTNVVSTFSYYPQWKLRDCDKGFNERHDVVNGIPVHRLKMLVPKSGGTLGRMISDLTFTLHLAWSGRSSWRKSDLVISACPMLGQMLALRLTDPYGRQPKIAVVQDFVVDAALELNMVGGFGIGYVLHKIERWIFKGFDTLSSISPEMHAKLRTKVPADKRTLFIPNWIHKSLQDAIDLGLKRSGPRKTKTLFYSGNVGRKQGLPVFLESFDGTSNGWVLDINGGGAEFSRLKEANGSRKDVRLGPLQDEDKYIDSLLSSSACLITQMPGVGANFLPSKILPALASGTPILAVCEPNSPLGREVVSAKCGAVVTPGDIESLQKVLADWAANPGLLEEYGRNARIWGNRYSRETVLGQYRTEIERLIEARAKGGDGNGSRGSP